jgi:hypothetical protein
MKKIYLLLCFLFIGTYTAFSQSISLDGKAYSVDTLASYKVGPGSDYTALRLKNTARLDVYFLKVSTQNPYVTFKSVLGQDSIYTGERPSSMAQRKTKDGTVYFAGTNANFYNTAGYVGYPISTSMVDGEIGTIPTSDRKNFAVADGKIPFIGLATYNGVLKFGANSWNINSVNHLRAENKLLLFNQLNGKTTRTNSFGTEVLIELADGYSWSTNVPLKAKVLKVEQNVGNMAIPKGKAVLSGHGTAAASLNTLQVGDEIELNLGIVLNNAEASTYTQAVSGDNYALMLKDGVVETSSVWDELHPRTGIGYTQKKDSVIFCVVDGRGASVGVTTKQLAQLMLSAGAYTAVNLDGGGSSCMYLKDFGVVNTSSDGSERAVANGIFAVSTAPQDDVVAEIEPYTKTFWVPHYGIVAPSFLSYNQYGALLSKNQQGVVLSCPPEVGEILSDGRFIASGANGGVVTATYNGITTTIHVNLEASAEVAFRLDSVLINDTFEYPIQVQSRIGNTTIDVLPQALQWKVANPEICSVEGGTLKGLTNGTTNVIGSLGDFSDTLDVTVQMAAAPQLTIDKFVPSDWTLSASTSLNVAFNSDNLPANWGHGSALNFVYATTRAPFITLSRNFAAYSLPDSLKITFNSGAIAFNKLILSMRANNSTASVAKEFPISQSDNDRQIAVAMKDWFDVTDIASFPIHFEYVKFLLGALNSGQSYSLKMKDIELVYNSSTVGIDPQLSSDELVVYPNPVKDKTLYINQKGNVSSFKVEIFQLSGRKVFQRDQKGVSGVVSYRLDGLKSGVYLLKVTTNNQAKAIKLIVD